MASATEPPQVLSEKKTVKGLFGGTLVLRQINMESWKIQASPYARDAAEQGSPKLLTESV